MSYDAMPPIPKERDLGSMFICEPNKIDRNRVFDEQIFVLAIIDASPYVEGIGGGDVVMSGLGNVVRLLHLSNGDHRSNQQ
jgi:hypothetical protein